MGKQPRVQVEQDMTEYRIPRDEEPHDCPKCGGYVSAQDNLYSGGFETKKYKCDACGFHYREIWQFQKWEPIGAHRLAE